MRKAFVPTILLGLTCCGRNIPTSESKAEKAPHSLEEKLNRIILPDAPDCAGLTLDRAVNLLRAKSREADTASPETEKGVNFVIVSGGDTILPATIGLKLHDVPLGEAVRGLSSLAGMTCRVDPHAVVITPPKSTPLPALTEADAPTEREKRWFHKWSHIILPAVSWSDASVEEAAEFLRAKDRCYFDGVPTPINIVLDCQNKAPRQPVTLDLRDIPLTEVLRYTAEICGLTVSLRHSALILSDHVPPLPRKTAAKPGAAEERAARIILPAISLSEASLDESLDFLRAKARELDPQHKEPVITVRPGGGSIIHDLSLKEISLLDALNLVAMVTSHVVSCEGETFILTPTPQPGK